MPIYLEMPKLSDTMTEGTIVSWKKSEGDTIEMGEVVAEVETDKATMEMEAFDDGKLYKIMVGEGTAAQVGAAIAVLLAAGEEPPSDEEIAEKAGGGAQAAAPEPEQQAAQPKSQPEPEQKEKEQPESKPAASSTKQAAASPAAVSFDGVKASPLAKKLAAAEGIDISRFKGSGPGGRIVADDVRDAIRFGMTGGAAEAAYTPTGGPEPGSEETVPLSGMRKAIAQRLVESKTQLPHFYLTIEVDAAPLMTLRKSLKEGGDDFGFGKVTVNDFILRATAIAAKQVPMINARFTNDGIIQSGSVQLAVAVAIDDGLITPVIKDAQAKGLRAISAEMKELATKARERKLTPEEYQGGTITVSNLGAYGIDHFYAIINPPQAAILAIGSVVKKPVVNEAGEIVVGQRMSIGLSGDHRVVDGAVGAEFLAAFKKLLESPALLLA